MLFPEVCDTYMFNNTVCVKTELLVVITAILCSVDCIPCFKVARGTKLL